MEKELEGYKKTLKAQNVALILSALAVMCFIVLGFMQIINPVGADERWAAMWNGFISGVSMAVVVCMAIGFIMNLRALKSDEQLKKQYIKEHDERALAIAQLSGKQSYWFETLGLLLGVIIGGYFNPVVSLVCLGCLLYICIVRLSLKIYYAGKI